MEPRILIIDDDILSSTTLANHLKQADFNVIGLVHSPYEAIKEVKLARPNVILMDIVFHESIDGIDTAEMIGTFWDGVLIFMTGHDDDRHMQRAKRLNPSAYIIKPFNLNSVNRAIEIAFHNRADKVLSENPDKAYISNSIFILYKGGYKRLYKKDIICIEANGSYTHVYTKEQIYTLSTHLKNIGQQLSDKRFFRLSRKYIVNLDYLISMEGNALYLKHYEKCLLIGDKYRSELFNLLKIIKSK